MNRIHELDALRGIALFGILLVNILIFHAPYSYYSEFYGAFTAKEGIIIEFIVRFASGKFLFIFAFLFGYGFQLQQNYIKIGFTNFYLRKMLILFLFGIIHILFFWFGDILASYAILGAVLLCLTRLPNKLILPIGILFLFFSPLYHLGQVIWDLPMVSMGKPAKISEFFYRFSKWKLLRNF